MTLITSSPELQLCEALFNYPAAHSLFLVNSLTCTQAVYSSVAKLSSPLCTPPMKKLCELKATKLSVYF